MSAFRDIINSMAEDNFRDLERDQRKKKPKPYRGQYLRNKQCFSNAGVIFHVEEGAIKMGHWPHCGMDAKTAKRFGEWLIKRSEELTPSGGTDQSKEFQNSMPGEE